MKNIFATLSLATLLLAASAASAQTAPAAQSATGTAAPVKTEWKEKDEFHKVIAQTFHPMEEGNYEPIRKRSGELHDKAVAWQNAKAPAEFNNDKIAASLRQLNADTKRLHDVVKNNGSDANIAEGLTKVHDTFHQIVGLCDPSKEHGKGHHGHDHSDPNHKH